MFYEIELPVHLLINCRLTNVVELVYFSSLRGVHRSKFIVILVKIGYKMFGRNVIWVFIFAIVIRFVRLEDLDVQNEIMDSNYSGDHTKYDIQPIPANEPLQPQVYGPRPQPESWIDTARNALSGPAGQIVVHMAKEMISRSTGNSQVLNYPNIRPSLEIS